MMHVQRAPRSREMRGEIVWIRSAYKILGGGRKRRSSDSSNIGSAMDGKETSNDRG